MSFISDAELAEDHFFGALLAGDAASLDTVLAGDFLIVDVSSGAVADRASFVGALRDGSLEFHRIELVERLTRRYGETAIIVGRTEMSGTFGGVGFAASSRYTHVLVHDSDDGRWRLATAQGTSIAEPPR
jgi:ketosteroid isomerase-like protein